MAAETIRTSVGPDGLVHLEHHCPEGGVDMGGPLLLERTSVPWLVDALRRCLSDGARREATLEGDVLVVVGKGHEMDPTIAIGNARRAAPRAEGYFLVIREAVIEVLVEQLEALAADSGGEPK